MKEPPQGAATMSNQGRHFEVSNEMQSLAEAGFEQARKALDGAQQTANSIRVATRRFATAFEISAARQSPLPSRI